jgi:hypothetical protein
MKISVKHYSDIFDTNITVTEWHPEEDYLVWCNHAGATEEWINDEVNFNDGRCFDISGYNIICDKCSAIYYPIINMWDQINIGKTREEM